ncbi:hypothetical protein CCR83_14210 [Rhodobacter veldkampii DSM 11550]|uniref:Cytochrome B n=2 Tax=Phaeovulum veldkampii TaxID=33049 RepID=A0A2T4JIQ3_9RHOB|nr:hypothetical protein [Phaeovulum veldkampii DSM 11550]PTE17775.1 cytochrome B [Phaeovulum veldkampii DSM 11550]
MPPRQVSWWGCRWPIWWPSSCAKTPEGWRNAGHGRIIRGISPCSCEAPMKVTQGYSGTQIALHWIVAVLIVMQFGFGDAIATAFDAASKGEEIAFNPMILQHVAGGALILLLGIWRLKLILTRGAPAAPEGGKPAAKILAKASTGMLYLFMLAMPISGSVAWFGGVEAAANMHNLGKIFLMLFVLLHIAGAVYHQVVLKDNLIARMMKAG